MISGFLEWVTQLAQMALFECLPSLTKNKQSNHHPTYAHITLGGYPTYAVSFDFNYRLGHLGVIE